MPLRCVPAVALSAIIIAVSTVSAWAQTSAPPVYKLAWWNIQSAQGETPLPGHPVTFTKNHNCTDPTKPLNAWGVGLVPGELRAKIAADPQIIALGLAEAWFCGNPENVRRELGWPVRTGERNGLGIMARYGFAGPDRWIQLDTTLNDNPADARYVVRVPVCTDPSCSSTVIVFATHWYGSGLQAMTSYANQLQATIDFMAADNPVPHVLIGDLNVFEGPSNVCGQSPHNGFYQPLIAAGYVDLWPAVHGTDEGFTGMPNRLRCGVPEGYGWKRIDFAWLHGYNSVGMTRWGMMPPGDGSPSDHYGITAAFSNRPVTVPPSDPLEIVLRASNATTLAGGWRVEADDSAAGALKVHHLDTGAAKVTSPAAVPVNYFDVTFNAVANVPYRLWIRGRADRDSYDNDSVYVQFSGAIGATGPLYRIGTTSATPIVLEDCTNCWPKGWGWQDNGYGLSVLGPTIRFETSGPQTIRVQTREDGLSIDQIVLSADRYLTLAPGALKLDSTILP